MEHPPHLRPFTVSLDPADAVAIEAEQKPEPEVEKSGRLLQPVMLGLFAITSFSVALYAMQSTGLERAPAARDSNQAAREAIAEPVAQVPDTADRADSDPRDQTLQTQIRELTFQLLPDILKGQKLVAGETVDLLAISRGEKTEVQYRSLLNEVRVKAVEESAAGTEAEAPAAVTLEMTGEQAAIVDYAIETGDVRLVP